MTALIASTHRIPAALVAGAVALALLVAYCQLLIGDAVLPVGRSLGWATTTLFSWIIFGAAIWRFRDRIVWRVERATAGDFAATVALIFGVAIAALLLSRIFSAMAGLCPLWLAAAARQLLRLAPTLLIVAVAVTAIIAAHRWRSALAEQRHQLAAIYPRHQTEWIEFPDDPRLRFRASDVAFFRTARNYCEFNVEGRTFLVRITAKALEQRLAPLGFARVHRSVIVNLARVRMVEGEAGGRLRLMLDDGSRVGVSRAYAKSMNRWLPPAPGEQRVELALAAE